LAAAVAVLILQRQARQVVQAAVVRLQAQQAAQVQQDKVMQAALHIHLHLGQQAVVVEQQPSVEMVFLQLQAQAELAHLLIHHGVWRLELVKTYQALITMQVAVVVGLLLAVAAQQAQAETVVELLELAHHQYLPLQQQTQAAVVVVQDKVDQFSQAVLAVQEL
jgi:hypothetical protein